jgi:hypothetical protein
MMTDQEKYEATSEHLRQELARVKVIKAEIFDDFRQNFYEALMSRKYQILDVAAKEHALGLALDEIAPLVAMRRPYAVFLRLLHSQLRDCIVPTTSREFELDARAGYYTSQLIEFGEKLDGQ